MLSIPKTYFFPHEIPYNKKSGIQPLLLQLANFQKVPIALRHCLTTAVPIIYIYCITSILPLQEKESRIGLKKRMILSYHPFFRARDGTRTRDPDLGKVVLHQLSHSRMSYILRLFLDARYSLSKHSTFVNFFFNFFYIFYNPSTLSLYFTR